MALENQGSKPVDRASQQDDDKDTLQIAEDSEVQAVSNRLLERNRHVYEELAK